MGRRSSGSTPDRELLEQRLHQRLQEEVAEEEVLHHRLVRDVEEHEERCSGPARAVLTRGAVEERRAVSLGGNVGEQPPVSGPRTVQKHEMAILLGPHRDAASISEPFLGGLRTGQHLHYASRAA